MDKRLEPEEQFSPEKGRDEIITVFEGLMASAKEHIQSEYDAQRIRGQEYSQVFLGSLQSAMAQAVTYLMGMDLSNENKEKILADIAQSNYVTETQLPAQVAQVNAETSKVEAEQNLVEEQTNEVLYRINSLLPAETALKTEQKYFVSSQISELDYRTNNLLPAETLLKTEQRDFVSSQINELDYRANNLLPAETSLKIEQRDFVSSQISELNYRISSILPKESALLDSQISKNNADTDLTTVQISKTNADTNLITAQISKTGADTALVNTQNNLTNLQLATEDARKVKLQAEEQLINAKTSHEVNFLQNLASQKTLTDAQTAAMQQEPAIKVYKIQADLTSARWVANGEADTTTPTPPPGF